MFVASGFSISMYMNEPWEFRSPALLDDTVTFYRESVSTTRAVTYLCVSGRQRSLSTSLRASASVDALLDR